jgi:hypothetical protein
MQKPFEDWKREVQELFRSVGAAPSPCWVYDDELRAAHRTGLSPQAVLSLYKGPRGMTPIKLSDGHYEVSDEAVAKFGHELLDKLNQVERRAP